VLVPDSTRDGEWMIRVGPGTYRESREHVKKAVTRRRKWKITPEFLEKVAKVHVNAREGQRLAAVQTEFQVEERQALRYIAAAREARLIND
jgi:hypothetical protein